MRKFHFRVQRRDLAIEAHGDIRDAEREKFSAKDWRLMPWEAVAKIMTERGYPLTMKCAQVTGSKAARKFRQRLRAAILER